MLDDFDLLPEYSGDPIDLHEAFQTSQEPFEDDKNTSAKAKQDQPLCTGSQSNEYSSTQSTQSTQPPSSEPQVADEEWKKLATNMHGRGQPIDLPKHKRMRYLDSVKNGAVMKAIREDEDQATDDVSVSEPSNDPGQRPTARNRQTISPQPQLEIVPDSEPSSPNPSDDARTDLHNFSLKTTPVQKRKFLSSSSSEVIPDSEPQSRCASPISGQSVQLQLISVGASPERCDGDAVKTPHGTRLEGEEIYEQNSMPRGESDALVKSSSRQSLLREHSSIEVTTDTKDTEEGKSEALKGLSTAHGLRKHALEEPSEEPKAKRRKR